MKKLKYTGGRTKPFTAKCPSGNRYPVEPEVSCVIEVEDSDALHLLGSQSKPWKPADVDATPIPMAELPKPPKEKAK